MAPPSGSAAQIVSSRLPQRLKPRHGGEPEGIRLAVDHAIARREWGIARTRLRELVRTAPGTAVANFVSERMLQIPVPLTRCRMAFLRSFTLEPVVPLLRAEAVLYGIDIVSQIGPFNAYATELLDTDSALYRFEADVVILAIQTRDLLPQFWEGFADVS